ARPTPRQRGVRPAHLCPPRGGPGRRRGLLAQGAGCAQPVTRPVRIQGKVRAGMGAALPDRRGRGRPGASAAGPVSSALSGADPALVEPGPEHSAAFLTYRSRPLYCPVKVLESTAIISRPTSTPARTPMALAASV